MAYRLRLLGMAVVIVTSVTTAVLAPGRGWIFWLSVALAAAAAAGAWRILNEPRRR